MLKIGVMLDSMQQPAWVLKMLELIAAADYATLEVCVINDSPQQTQRKSLWRKIADNRHRFLYGFFRKLEYRLFGRQVTAFEMHDVSALFENSKKIAVRPDQTRFTDTFSAHDVGHIREHKLDVLIRLGFRILKGDVLNSAKLGVWSLHHGDNRVNRGVPPGFWEVLEGWPTTGAVLQRLTEELDGGVIISRSASTTIRPTVLGNLENYYWKSAWMVPRALRRLSAIGAGEFEKELRRENQHPAFYSREIYKIPGNMRMLRLLTVHSLRYLRARLRSRLFFYQWVMLFSFAQGARIPENVSRFKRIVPPKDRFWADPHVFKKDEKIFVFFEELVFKEDKGTIGVLEIGRDGSVGPPKRVLERPYHLSYPFVFEAGGKIYMIPETMDNGTIELYEAKAFPDRWEFVMNLMEDVRAVDATIFERGGKWWMFANISEHAKIPTSDELFIFCANEFPTNHWTPHPLNPVVSDASAARPAGRFFTREGNLYRPSQDCSWHYGRGLNVNLVNRLSATEYAEERVSQIEPLWAPDIRSVHTLAVDDDIVVIDAEIRRARFWR